MCTWDQGSEATTARIFAATIAACRTSPEITYGVEELRARPGFMRVSFQVRTEESILDKLFNHPCGLRGLYYRSVEDGDRFTQTMLQNLQLLLRANRIVRREGGRAVWISQFFDTAVARGKVWIKEDTRSKPAIDNPRWRMDRIKLNRDELIRETGLSRAEFEQILGHSFDFLAAEGSREFKGDTIDIKSAWFNAAGEYFTVPRKVHRGATIKWIGFS